MKIHLFHPADEGEATMVVFEGLAAPDDAASGRHAVLVGVMGIERGSHRTTMTLDGIIDVTVPEGVR